MKVALELQPCCGKRTGIGVYTYELAKRLKNQGDLEFCGNLFNFAGRNDNSQALQGITIPIRESRLFPYGIYRRIWNAVPIPYDSLFHDKADLTIFFNYIVPPHMSGHVMTVIHDMTYLRFPETMNAKNLRRIQKGIQYSVERSSRILTDSEFSKREIVELLKVPGRKISVVPGAPSLLCESVDFTKLSRETGIHYPFLLYVGTIEPRKNIARLLRAFDLLKERHRIPHQLVLAGGRGWGTEEIYRTAEEISYAQDVVFTGYISDAEKNALYQNADIFLFPSVYEGFGIPPLEAMHHGCPVVCSNAASLPEVVGDAAELVDPLDIESIAAGIWRVLSDQAYAQSLVKRGYCQAKKFTWEASANRLTEICREFGRQRGD